MEPKKGARDMAAGGGPSQLSRLLTTIVESLPLFDRKAFTEALAEVKEHPRASVNYLFDVFGSKDAARRALAARLLAALGNADVQDNLNALIFDAGQDDETKVLANELLTELGNPVDPDVFAMSVEKADELRAKLPSRAMELLKSGDTAGAVAHARTLANAERWLLMQRAAAERKEAAVPFLETLARDGEADAQAAVAAITGEKLTGGLALLSELQRTGDKEMQKIIKKAFFDLREAGVEVPAEEKPQPAPAAAPEAAAEETAEGEENLPLYRALVSETSPQGLILVTVARVRPNGRLKVFSVLVDLWKRGIQQAAMRTVMSKSSFDRFLESQGGGKLRMKTATLEECRRVVARGVCVAKELQTPLPFDFGMGRAVLGAIDAEMATIKNPFLCSVCGKELDTETVQKVRAAAPYDNIRVETRCPECRKVG